MATSGGASPDELIFATLIDCILHSRYYQCTPVTTPVATATSLSSSSPQPSSTTTSVSASASSIFVRHAYFCNSHRRLIVKPLQLPRPSSSTSMSAPTPSSAGCVGGTQWGQCGGTGYTGTTCCKSTISTHFELGTLTLRLTEAGPAGWSCQYNSPYYSQCLAGTPSTATSVRLSVKKV